MALGLLAVEIGAFAAVQLTHSEAHEWAMCVLFCSFIWAPWGTLSSVVQLIGSRYGRRGQWLTALCIYVGALIALVVIVKNHLFGQVIYGDF